ncbi:beta-ketoacyl synthase chain length factor [Vibrio sp. DW001]|uniref:beta-ketoacyl synthase chain length factor n=1 Tax=Vibrio sp. DW001 TaxID=2912315 RepID=UPI0023B137C5|nr:beta-ketoacyl synthase chain length factor [Vibrio sp. DW001]WED25952.1 beta-ketoacyl synthase chain length factor [Vibrio sp. DW001]
MTNNKNIISFKVDDYHILSENIASADDWNAWLSDPEFESSAKTPTHHIPAMMRRRMSPLSKMSVQVALELIERHNIGYIVFSSRHGELPRTVELIKSILAGDDASPMAFSQSVHNTAAGLTTIAAKQAIPVTSLSAGQDTFHQALIESFIYLSEKTETYELAEKKVLLVDFDAPLPTEYQEFEHEHFATYAFGIVLSAGEDYRITWQSNAHRDSDSMTKVESPSIPEKNKKTVTSLPQSIQCLRRILSNDNAWRISSSRILWSWNRSA